MADERDAWPPNPSQDTVAIPEWAFIGRTGTASAKLITTTRVLQMMSMKRLLSFFVLAVFMSIANIALAQDKNTESPTAGKDHTLTKEELAKYAVLANRQLVTLTDAAIKNVKSDLEENGLVSPSAMMMLNDGTMKPLKLGQEASSAPFGVQVVMFRAALKSMARHDKITAAAIIYGAGQTDASGKNALIIEYEHRLGVSGLKLVPYTQDHGKIAYGDVLNKKKPFQLFYDPRPDQQSTASAGS